MLGGDAEDDDTDVADIVGIELHEDVEHVVEADVEEVQEVDVVEQVDEGFSSSSGESANKGLLS